VPGAQMAENLLRDLGVVNDRDDAHGVLADGAPQRVDVPDAEDELAPAFGGEFGWRWRANAGAAHNQFGRQAALAHAAHFVGVPAVVADRDRFPAQPYHAPVNKQ